MTSGDSLAAEQFYPSYSAVAKHHPACPEGNMATVESFSTDIGTGYSKRQQLSTK
jgi:hypothetical protein